MGKKDKKRSEAEAATVVVEAEAVTAAGVGEPVADVGEVSMAVDGDSSVAAKKDKKKKDKKEKSSSSSSKKEGKKEKSKERKELEIPADALSPIAHPLAGRKLNKSTLKLVKRGMCSAMLFLRLLLPSNRLADFAFFVAAAARARHVKRGVKEVVKALKKGEKG